MMKMTFSFGKSCTSQNAFNWPLNIAEGDANLRLDSTITVLYDSCIYEPVHEISNNVVCATSKASDQPAHTRSLIRAFASRLSIL